MPGSRRISSCNSCSTRKVSTCRVQILKTPSLFALSHLVQLLRNRTCDYWQSKQVQLTVSALCGQVAGKLVRFPERRLSFLTLNCSSEGIEIKRLAIMSFVRSPLHWVVRIR